MRMSQLKSRKVVVIFFLAALLSFMYHTSYSFYYIISNRYGGIKIMHAASRNSNEVDVENLKLPPINLPYNTRFLRSNIICGKNVTCGKMNTSGSDQEVRAKNKTLYREKDSLIDYFQNYYAEKNELCPLVPPNLGPVPGDKSIVGLYGIENMYIDIVVGGIHTPSACIARQNAAIIVPLHENNGRMRKYLASFLYYMHPFLMKQQLAYQIFVVCKLNATTPYRRGELFNIGFEVAQTKRPEGWMCFIFHDPHIVPEDTRNLYRCSTYRPKRLMADTRKPPRFGGVIAVRPDVFVKINGFSNLAWNNDDDYIDMYRRFVLSNVSLETNTSPVGKYSSLAFLRQVNNHSVSRKQTTPSVKRSQEGLNNVKLTIISIEYQQLYTLVNVV